MDEKEFDLSMLQGGSKAALFLNDEMDIRVQYHEETPVVIKLPQTAIFTIQYTDPTPSSSTTEGKGCSLFFEYKTVAAFINHFNSK